MDTYSQAQLVLDLCKVFPAFANYWERAAEEDPPSDSLHAVYMSFLPFLGSCSATPEQWRLLATIVSREVAAGGARENAVDTCMPVAERSGKDARAYLTM